MDPYEFFEVVSVIFMEVMLGKTAEDLFRYLHDECYLMFIK